MAFAPNIEQWRLVDGYDNYEISSHGRVRNNQSGRILKSCMITNGYNYVNLYKDIKAKKHNIHRLVCSAFCVNPNNYDVVDHIDRIKTNNMFNNLRWCTSSENSRNRTIRKDNTTGIKGIDKFRNSWRAQCIDNEGKRQSKYFSIARLGDDEAKALATQWRNAKEVEFGYL